MKLVRFGNRGFEKPGIVDSAGNLRDASQIIPDFLPETVGPDLIERLKCADLPVVDAKGLRFGAPLARSGTIWCVGLNYALHAKEAGLPIPEEPILFSKAAGTLCGPNDDILFADGMTKLDWEVELAIVIGTPALRVEAGSALEHVLGYAIVNDVSERAWQMERGGQWMKGKSFPNFCPLGPSIVTADEVGDPQSLHLWLEVNGERLQDGNTDDMIFSVAAIISYMSQFTRLMPGDIICTGTPSGVGAGFDPPRWLKPGDRVRLGIDGLGVQEQTVAAL
ncbi:fumarylacetoacetate hydrolase family protein [Sphingopyxis sp. DHUNG17]|uniref:fumarylacetoacetate hydrolase family protein n=1 Tax=Sphingopyxis jiangsuensis TaxID=2871171 RepID=UPI00191E0976|nr:fumarylacetoacetate hydrolase family protein [Sphingopyxis lutea]MBL0770114.1 fumarylacetoacetate hydrolase family protein [Sphingopyxis lutea]